MSVATGKQGRYIVDLGFLIKKDTKSPATIGSQIVLFVENFKLSAKGETKDLLKVEEAFQVPPTKVDAAYFSPCRGLSYSSMPNECLEQEENEEKSTKNNFSGVLNSWDLPGKEFLGNEVDNGFEKAKTFMASSQVINDSRMMVVKQLHDGKYV